MKRKIYVASSWRNSWYPEVVAALKPLHEVYDFRNPAPGNSGFSWSQCDPNYRGWTMQEYVKNLHHFASQKGFELDRAALHWSDTCVLVLPCGRSAHLEAGYAAGQGKRTIFLLHPDKFEPELMYLLGHGFATTIPELIAALDVPDLDCTRMAGGA